MFVCIIRHKISGLRQVWFSFFAKQKRQRVGPTFSLGFDKFWYCFSIFFSAFRWVFNLFLNLFIYLNFYQFFQFLIRSFFNFFGTFTDIDIANNLGFRIIICIKRVQNVSTSLSFPSFLRELENKQPKYITKSTKREFISVQSKG